MKLSAIIASGLAASLGGLALYLYSSKRITAGTRPVAHSTKSQTSSVESSAPSRSQATPPSTPGKARGTSSAPATPVTPESRRGQRQRTPGSSSSSIRRDSTPSKSISLDSTGPLASHGYFKHAILGHHSMNMRQVEQRFNVHVNVFSVESGRWRVKIIGESPDADLHGASLELRDRMERLCADMVEDPLFSWRGIQTRIDNVSQRTGSHIQLGYGAIAVVGLKEQVADAVDELKGLVSSAIILSLPYVGRKTGLLIGKQGVNVMSVRQRFDVYIHVESESSMLHMVGFNEKSLNSAVAFLEHKAPKTLRRMVQMSIPVPLSTVPKDGLKPVLERNALEISGQTEESFDLLGITRYSVEQGRDQIYELLGVSLADS